MSSDWKEIKLSEAMEIIGGGTPKTSNNEYWDGNIPWLSVVDFNNENRWVHTTEKFITEKGLQQSSTKKLKSGQLIISARGTVGALAQLSKEMAFNQSCYGLNANPKITSNDFLYYALKSIVTNIRQSTHGAVFDTITKGTFDHLTFKFPPLSQQILITNVLSSIDRKIELNRQMCKTLEDIASTLFKSWFIDFDPVKAKAAGREPEGLSPEIADLFPDSFVDSSLGQIPKGWEISSIYQLIDICYGAPYKSELFNQEKRGLPVIRIRDLKTGEPGNFTEEKHPREIRVRPGDVLAGMDAEFMPFIWKGAIAVLNQRVLLARPKSPLISNSFVMEMLKPLMAIEQNAQVGTTVAHIGKKDIDKFKICNPGLKILHSHQAICEPFLRKSINNYKQIYSLTNIRESLLPKLINGEIKIQEAETLISAKI